MIFLFRLLFIVFLVADVHAQDCTLEGQVWINGECATETIEGKCESGADVAESECQDSEKVKALDEQLNQEASRMLYISIFLNGVIAIVAAIFIRKKLRDI